MSEEIRRMFENNADRKRRMKKSTVTKIAVMAGAAALSAQSPVSTLQVYAQDEQPAEITNEVKTPDGIPVQADTAPEQAQAVQTRAEGSNPADLYTAAAKVTGDGRALLTYQGNSFLFLLDPGMELEPGKTPLVNLKNGVLTLNALMRPGATYDSEVAGLRATEADRQKMKQIGIEKIHLSVANDQAMYDYQVDQGSGFWHNLLFDAKDQSTGNMITGNQVPEAAVTAAESIVSTVGADAIATIRYNAAQQSLDVNMLSMSADSPAAISWEGQAEDNLLGIEPGADTLAGHAKDSVFSGAGADTVFGGSNDNLWVTDTPTGDNTEVISVSKAQPQTSQSEKQAVLSMAEAENYTVAGMSLAKLDEMLQQGKLNGISIVVTKP